MLVEENAILQLEIVSNFSSKVCFLPFGATFWISGVLQKIFYFFHARLRETDMRFAVWHSEFIGAV